MFEGGFYFDGIERVEHNGGSLKGANEMRNISIGILIVFLVAAPLAFTQTPSETIFIEVPLQIGMTKDAAISRLAEQGLTLSKAKGMETWAVARKNERAHRNMMRSERNEHKRRKGESVQYNTRSEPIRVPSKIVK